MRRGRVIKGKFFSEYVQISVVSESRFGFSEMLSSLMFFLLQAEGLPHRSRGEASGHRKAIFFLRLGLIHAFYTHRRRKVERKVNEQTVKGG
jgi:hypothetical protein